MPGTDKLPSNEFVRLVRIVPEKIDYQRECSKVRTGTVFLPVGDGVGANADQFGHVLLEEASLGSPGPNVVT